MTTKQKKKPSVATQLKEAKQLITDLKGQNRELNTKTYKVYELERQVLTLGKNLEREARNAQSAYSQLGELNNEIQQVNSFLNNCENAPPEFTPKRDMYSPEQRIPTMVRLALWLSK